MTPGGTTEPDRTPGAPRLDIGEWSPSTRRPERAITVRMGKHTLHSQHIGIIVFAFATMVTLSACGASGSGVSTAALDPTTTHVADNGIDVHVPGEAPLATTTTTSSPGEASADAPASTTTSPTTVPTHAPSKSSEGSGNSAQTDTTRHDWKNERYPIDWGDGRTTVQFHDGTFTGPTFAGSFTVQARVEAVHGIGQEHADLNGDGIDDAIVSITVDISPTVAIAEQHVFLGPEPARSVGYVVGEFLGDDWQGKDVPVVSYTYKGDEPRCCPSIEDRKIYSVRNNRLVLTYHQTNDLG